MKIIDDDIKHIRTRFEEFAWVLALNGYSVSYPKVGDLLRELGYSLQANRKMLEGTEHPDNNAQFEFINDQTKQRLVAGNPVTSVDTKSAYKNNGTPNWTIPCTRQASKSVTLSLKKSVSREMIFTANGTTELLRTLADLIIAINEPILGVVIPPQLQPFHCILHWQVNSDKAQFSGTYGTIGIILNYFLY